MANVMFGIDRLPRRNQNDDDVFRRATSWPTGLKRGQSKDYAPLCPIVPRYPLPPRASINNSGLQSTIRVCIIAERLAQPQHLTEESQQHARRSTPEYGRRTVCSCESNCLPPCWVCRQKIEHGNQLPASDASDSRSQQAMLNVCGALHYPGTVGQIVLSFRPPPLIGDGRWVRAVAWPPPCWEKSSNVLVYTEWVYRMRMPGVVIRTSPLYSHGAVYSAYSV